MRAMHILYRLSILILSQYLWHMNLLYIKESHVGRPSSSVGRVRDPHTEASASLQQPRESPTCRPLLHVISPLTGSVEIIVLLSPGSEAKPDM